MDQFLGEPVSFWVEIKHRMQEGKDYHEVAALLVEIHELRGRLDFYESRIKQMAKIMNEGK